MTRREAHLWILVVIGTGLVLLVFASWIMFVAVLGRATGAWQ